MAIVKKISVDDPQGAPEIKDIGADAVNVDYDEEHSVKDKIDELSENVSTLSSTIEDKLDAEGGSLAATVAGSVTTQTSSSDVSDVDTAALIWGKFNALRKEFGDHVNSPLYTENGIHGIRYYGGVLQVWDSINETWTDVGGGAEYPEGGSTGQALIKASAADNDVAWGNISLVSNVSGTLPVVNGGTGATTTSDARTNLGLGSLATKSSASLTTDVTDTLPLANGGTGATTAANARTNLGLGSLATKSSASLTSDVSGTLPIAQGGTGASTVAGARNALGLGNTSGALPVANGGTGATSASSARSNLGLGSLATKSTASLTSDVSGVLPIANGGTGNSAGYIRTGQKSGTSIGNYATAEGSNTTASRVCSHAEGDNTTASGICSHAEGASTIASSDESHAEGASTTASGSCSHAEGEQTTASGAYSHAEGQGTTAGSWSSHAEGCGTKAIGSGSHAEGYSQQQGSSTVGIYTGGAGAHAEGCMEGSTSYIRATGKGSHAEGYTYQTTGILASGDGSHAQGLDNVTASGNGSYAQGINITASGYCSHAEGVGHTASGYAAHAEGSSTTASGDYPHTEGRGTIAGTLNHAQGHYNKSMTAGSESNTSGDAMAIGNGRSSLLSNCFRVTYAGAVYGLSAFNSSGADYAEFFEWEDGNEANEDRVGYFVTLSSDKIKKANAGNYILGVISGQPSVIGNGDEDWLGRWQRDDFGRFIWGEVETENPITKEKQKARTILPNPEYDPKQKYIERKDRPEWDYVGMLGALAVRDNGECEVNGFCRCGDGGIAVPAESGYRVIKRVSNNVIKIIFSL